MGRKYTDNAKTVLSGAISAVATTLTVAAGKGDLFPQVTGAGTPGATPNAFVIKLKNAAGVIEKMRVEHRAAASDVMGSVGFPLIRGYDGTVAQAWSVGDFVSLTIERSAAQGWEDGFNANALGRAFGYKDSSTVGLVFGYYGGLVSSGGSLTTIADGTVALTASQTNFVERTTAGVVSANTAAFTAGRIPLYTVVTSATAITAITEKRSTLMQDVGGGLTVSSLLAPVLDSVTGSLVLKGAGTTAATFTGADTTLAGKLVVSGAGPHSFGGTDPDTQFRIVGTFAGGGTNGIIGLQYAGTLTPPAGASAWGSRIQATLNKAGSGTHDDFVNLNVLPPGIGAGAATLTNATTLKIEGAPSVGTNKRALWVASGLVSFDGGQIQFPATQLPSSDPNTLDDYEEGTFTLTLRFGGGTTGITYSIQSANYTKTGREVFIHYLLVLTSKGSSVGNADISAMPFTSDATFTRGSGAVVWANMTSALVTCVTLMGSNTTAASVSGLTAAATSLTPLTDTAFANTTSIQGSFFYATST